MYVKAMLFHPKNLAIPEIYVSIVSSSFIAHILIDPVSSREKEKGEIIHHYFTPMVIV